MTGSETVRLGEAATRFLAGLPAGERGASQQEIYRFVRWYGWEQTFAALTAPQVGNYAERLSQSDADCSKKLELVRAFLTYVRKQGWSKANLATYLKAKKANNKARASSRPQREPVPLTRQGHEELQAELASLLEKRPGLIEDIRRAAADKDFSENAPLDAAREQRGHLEGRIMELEELLGSVVIIDEARETGHRIAIGDGFVLQDTATGEEVAYTLVGPNEVDPANGRISAASPIGRAVVGKTEGAAIEVTVPAGKLRYRVVRIGG